MRKFIISMIAVFIIGYFLVEIYRNERQKNANIQLEEARFMRFAKHRIKENKLKKIPEFKFRYTPAKKQAELIEEMYFTGIAQRYLELGKLDLINEFEFKHTSFKKQLILLSKYTKQ